MSTYGTNDITGDKLISKASTEKYRNNYDSIFNKCKKQFPCGLKGDIVTTCNCVLNQTKDKDENLNT